MPRAFDIAADPPDYAVYGTSWQDEGLWNYSSAVAAADGKWPEVAPPMHKLVPLYSLVQRVVFGAVGSGVVPTRWVSIAAGLLGCFAVWSMFRPLGAQWQACASALYAADFWVVAVDRLAAPEAMSICCLAWSVRFLTDDQTLPSRPIAGLGLAALAVAVKPVAAFFLPIALVAAVRPALRRSSRARVIGIIAVVAVAFGGLAAFAMRESDVALALYLNRIDASVAVESGGAIRHYLETLHRELVAYEFAVHHTVPFMGIVLGLASVQGGHRRSVEKVCAVWLLSWWLSMPLTQFRDFRYAYIALPVALLGAAGFHRWMEGGFAVRPQWAAVVVTAWVAAMWSMWLSERTTLPGRVWAPLIGFLIAVSWALVSRRALVPPETAGRLSPLLIALMAVVVQAPPFARWALARTHHVVAAEHAVAAVPIKGMLCGLEASNLLLANPRNGLALTSSRVWHPDCRLEGRLADYVVVPDALECTSYGSPFVRDNHAALAQLPALVTVQLPPWRGTGSRSCRYSIVALRDGIIPPQ